MDLFKNEVGRPSNETLKKRRNFKIFISVFAVVAVLLVGFGVYKVLAPSKIEGEGLNADSFDHNRFNLVDHGNYDYSIAKPANAKNWKIEIKYKEDGKVIWKSYAKENHYGDGAKTHDFSLKSSDKKLTYRISVKWTKGKNNLTYSSPKNWAPKGWKYNLLTGWAYKDIVVNSNTNNSANKLDINVTYPKVVEDNKVYVANIFEMDEIKFSYSNSNHSKLYYSYQLSTKGSSSSTTLNGSTNEISKKTSKTIDLAYHLTDWGFQTKGNIDVIIYLYTTKDSKTPIASKKITYVINNENSNPINSDVSAKLKVNAPSLTIYAIPGGNLEITYSHTGNGRLYYQITENDTISPCLAMDANKKQTYSFWIPCINLEFEPREKVITISLYSSKTCSSSSLMDSYKSKTYKYIGK